mgnify:CR=1 FL=1
MYAYNPRKKSAEQLENSLVGDDRHAILADILAELDLAEGAAPKQHWMIVGARGMGKSHLLTLLHHKVCADEKLQKLWLPVLFPEEIRMAGDLARFLERAATEIRHDLERAGSPVAAELKEKIGRIRSIRAAERVEYLFNLITWIRQTTGRHILLIAENLQQLLGKKICIMDQKKLRAYLQSEDALLLIGSATTIFDALHDHSHPFYHFFHIRRLGELSYENIKTLVLNLLAGYGKEDQARIIMANEARLKVLHAFTGGNPRMAVFLSDILKTDVNEEMIDIMDRILDELTPYFEAIINETPEYLQEIINALASYEPAQSPKEIAEHLEMEPATVRNYLKQAKDNGYVRVAFSKGKSNYYCLNEYLYRTWFQMRDSSHREELRWLMELMLLLYSREQLVKENQRVEDTGESTSLYQRLVKQTCEFMLSNPTFCKTVELCAQQVGSRERIDKVVSKRKKTFSNEYMRRMEALDAEGMSKKEYLAISTQTIVEVLSEGKKDPLAQLIPYSLAIPVGFKMTLDIVTAIQDYGKYIIPIKVQHYELLSSMLNGVAGKDATRDISLLLHVALENYDKAAECAAFLLPEDKGDLLKSSVDLLIIQVIYYCHVAKVEQMARSCDALVDIGRITGHSIGMLLLALLLAHKTGVVKTENSLALFAYAKENHPKELFFLTLWFCFQNPESEIAQKLFAEPATAKVIAQINDLLAEADA